MIPPVHLAKRNYFGAMIMTDYICKPNAHTLHKNNTSPILKTDKTKPILLNASKDINRCFERLLAIYASRFAYPCV
jgi:hypothetical protein